MSQARERKPRAFFMAVRQRELARFVEYCTPQRCGHCVLDRESKARRVAAHGSSRLDLHTLFLGQTCLLAATAAMLWVSRSDADRGNGMRMWRYAITSQALAYLVLATPAGGLAATVTGLVANLAGAVGVAFFFIAIRQFAGRDFSLRTLVAMVAAVTIAGAVTGEHVAWAAIFNGFAYAGYEWLNAFTLWRNPRPGTRRVQRVVALVYLCMGMVLPARAVALLLIGQSRLVLDHDNAWQVPIYVFGFVYLVITNLGFVLMCKTRAEAETRLQARTDDLTGLANRRHWTTDARDALLARAATVVLVDVDHFKDVNDRHGHHTGDFVLVEIGRILSGHGFAGRLGGDELALVTPDADPSGITASAILVEVAAAFPSPDLEVSVSIGTATAWSPGADLAALLKRADAALYEAKRAGRGMHRAAADAA